MYPDVRNWKCGCTWDLEGEHAVLLPLVFLSSAPMPVVCGFPVTRALTCSEPILTPGFIHLFNELPLSIFAVAGTRHVAMALEWIRILPSTPAKGSQPGGRPWECPGVAVTSDGRPKTRICSLPVLEAESEIQVSQSCSLSGGSEE